MMIRENKTVKWRGEWSTERKLFWYFVKYIFSVQEQFCHVYYNTVSPGE